MSRESLIDYYIDKEMPIIPVSADGEKRALVKFKEFNARNPTKEEIFTWLGQFNGCEFGLVCGGQDHYVGIDCDDPNIYIKFFSDFKGMVYRTPSGGINFIVKSTVLPKKKMETCVNHMALDYKATNQYMTIPSGGIKRSWIEYNPDVENPKSLDDLFTDLDAPLGEPEEVGDIEALLKERLPEIEVKYSSDKSAIDYISNSGVEITYHGHGYVQTHCFLPSHKGEDAHGSLTIYKDGYYCFGCGGRGSILQLIKFHTNLTEDEILETYAGVKKTSRKESEKLMYMAEEHCSLVKDQNNNAYAIADTGKNQQILEISPKSVMLRFWLRELFFEFEGKQPSASSLSDATDYLFGKAQTKGKVVRITRRIGGTDKEVWYDFGGEKVGKISGDGIEYLPFDKSPIYFFRESDAGKSAIPTNYDIHNVKKLFDIINITRPEDQLLVLSWIVTCFIPTASHPILLLSGVKGSAKTRTAQIIKRLIDPAINTDNELLVFKPKDLDQLIHQLSHNCVVIFDNMSSIDQTTSDVFCQAVTGGAFRKRMLFTDNTSVSASIKSRVIMTSINRDVVSAADLAERTVAIELERPDGRYIKNSYLDDLFEVSKHDILGSILKILQLYLANNINNFNMYSDYRMTDYYNVGKFISELFGYDVDFSVLYKKVLIGLSSESLNSEPITDFLVAMAQEFPSGQHTDHRQVGMSFDHLFKEMQEFINDSPNKFSKRWPSSPRGFSQKLRRIEPDLKQVWGIVVKRTTVSGKSYALITKGEQQEIL